MTPAERLVARFQRKTAGASEFLVYVQDPDPKRAFRKAVDDAQYERGHGGYSGTIAEKSDFKVQSREPMTQAGAHEYANKHLHDANKWGPALAIPIADAKPGQSIKRGLVIEARDEWRAKADATQQARELYEAKHRGETFTVKVLSAKRQEGGAATPIPQPAPKASVFFWSRDKRDSSGREYKTKKEALDAFHSMPLTGLVDGETWTLMEKRAIGAFQIQGGISQKWEVEVEITPEATSGPIKGWLFFGLASS